MDVDEPRGSRDYRTHQPRRSRRPSRKPSRQRRSPSSSSDDQKAATGSDKSVSTKRRGKPTRWDVKSSLILLVEPRCDMTMEMRPGGAVSGLTARQPIPNEEQERQQRDDMDRQKEEERKRQIPAGTAEEPLLLPFLQEPALTTPMQPQCIVDRTRTEPVNVLIQKSARKEQAPQVMYQRGGRDGRGG